MWDAKKIGQLGGKSKSLRKQAAARVNGILGGAKGGRPIKLPEEPAGFRESQPSSIEISPKFGIRVRDTSAIGHMRRFLEYYAVVIAKKNHMAEPYFSEEEIGEALVRAGRRDLWKLRQKKQRMLSKAQRRAMRDVSKPQPSKH